MPLGSGDSALAEFKALHEQNFSPLLLTIKTFAEEKKLDVSNSIDPDPSGPHACYFCSWPTEIKRHQFIRICAEHPLAPGTSFYIDAENKHYHQRWSYSVSEGTQRLKEILLEAAKCLEA